MMANTSSNEREIITAPTGNDDVTGKKADDVIYGNDGDDDYLEILAMIFYKEEWVTITY